MIKLNIYINPDDIQTNKTKYDIDVSDSLDEIAALVRHHKSDDFKDRLWRKFKQSIWEQQYHKCAFCEKEIVSADDGQLEHFRPKAETCDEFNVRITREAYWWLAYEYKNYLVSCLTCNNLKGNRFPIEDEDTRVKATDMDGKVALTDGGVLENEIPFLINPRYQDPKPYLAYNYRPDTKMVFIEHKDADGIGEKTIKILDLNRRRKNIEVMKDFLPYKRGSILSEFKKELDNFKQLKMNLIKHRNSMDAIPDDQNLKKLVEEEDLNVNKKRDNIMERFLSKRAQFSGMCLFWLKYDTDLDIHFIENAA